MNLDLNPKLIAKILLYTFLAILTTHIIVVVIKLNTNHTNIFGLIPLFDFDSEANVPTLFSSLLLFFCVLILAFISLIRYRLGLDYLLWLILAIIFLFLVVDETACFHERLTVPLRNMMDLTGVLYFAWIIPYGILLCLFIILYVRFLMKLPKKIMILFIISGMIFVTGALGFESLGGMHAEKHGYHNAIFVTLYTIEEAFEMLGAILFIYTLLTYLIGEYKQITITLDDKL